MQAALKRVNNQLTVALPLSLAEAAGLREGMDVEVVVRGDSIVISLPDPTLEQLLARIDGPPPPMEWDDVEPRGSDVW